MPKRTGLDKGLDALIPTGQSVPSADGGGGITHIAVDLIQRNPRQPREKFDIEELDNLVAGAAAVRDLTQRVTAVLEAWIRRYPDQWRWIHWRWRERPDGSSETYRRSDLERTFAPPRDGGARQGRDARPSGQALVK